MQDIFLHEYYERRRAVEEALLARVATTLIGQYDVIATDRTPGRILHTARAKNRLWFLKERPHRHGPVSQGDELEGYYLRALEHEYIVLLEGVISDGESSYNIFPFAAGGSLRDRMAAGAIPPREVVYLSLTAALGMLVIHRRGFVHRDIKPENLLLFRDEDGSWSLRLADLGSVIQAPAGSQQQSSFSGTLRYAAPESVEGNAAQCSDVWSFGVVVLELLFGQHPYWDIAGNTSSSPELAVRLKQVGAVEGPSNSDDSSWLQALAIRCLARDPSNRPKAEDLVYAYLARVQFQNSHGEEVRANAGLHVFKFDKVALALVSERLLSVPPSHQIISVNFSWADTGKQVTELLLADTPESVAEAIRKIDNVLGSPGDPGSLIAEHVARRESAGVEPQGEAQDPLSLGANAVVIKPTVGVINLFIDLKLRALIQQVEFDASNDALERLAATLRLWEQETIGSLKAEWICHAAQGFAFLGMRELALSFIEYAVNQTEAGELGWSSAMLILVESGEHRAALEFGLQILNGNQAITQFTTGNLAFFACASALRLGEGHRIKPLVWSLFQSERDRGQFSLSVALCVLMLAHDLNGELVPQLWKQVRGPSLKVPNHSSTTVWFVVRLLLAYGERDMAQRRARALLESSHRRLVHDLALLAWFEAVAAGHDSTTLIPEGSELATAQGPVAAVRDTTRYHSNVISDRAWRIFQDSAHFYDKLTDDLNYPYFELRTFISRRADIAQLLLLALGADEAEAAVDSLVDKASPDGRFGAGKTAVYRIDAGELAGWAEAARALSERAEDGPHGLQVDTKQEAGWIAIARGSGRAFFEHVHKGRQSERTVTWSTGETGVLRIELSQSVTSRSAPTGP